VPVKTPVYSGVGDDTPVGRRWSITQKKKSASRYKEIDEKILERGEYEN
jgi:hypothetical protein